MRYLLLILFCQSLQTLAQEKGGALATPGLQAIYPHQPSHQSQSERSSFASSLGVKLKRQSKLTMGLHNGSLFCQSHEAVLVHYEFLRSILVLILYICLYIYKQAKNKAQHIPT